MKFDLKIRKFTYKDLDQVLDLHKKALEEIGAYKEEGSWDYDLKDIEKNYNNNYGLFLVGEIENKILAMGAFRKVSKDTAEVKRMRTYPEYQGKGYGKSILNELIKKAKAYNYKELILETSDKQLRAIKLYLNSGFKEYKKEIIDGFNCAWYKLNLKDSKHY